MTLCYIQLFQKATFFSCMSHACVFIGGIPIFRHFVLVYDQLHYHDFTHNFVGLYYCHVKKSTNSSLNYLSPFAKCHVSNTFCKNKAKINIFRPGQIFHQWRHLVVVVCCISMLSWYIRQLYLNPFMAGSQQHRSVWDFKDCVFGQLLF